jgi:hypothetical protein
MKRPKGEFHEIDKYRLDLEWIRQPKMTRYYNEKLAKAKKRMTLAKAAVKVREAEVGKKVRVKPKKYGISKLTEAAIASTVTALVFSKDCDEYMELVDAEFEVNMLIAAQETLRDRRKALEDLVALYFSGYFADPKKPKNVDKDKMKDYEESRIRGIRKRRKELK